MVLAREDEPGQKRLVAYVTLSQRERDGEAVGMFREALQTRAARLHGAVGVRDARGAAAHAQRQGGPEGAAGAGRGRRLLAPYVAPRNDVEAAICEVWQEVLGCERVGIEDNFFSLGGDSILSIRVVSLLKSRGLSVEIKDIFQYQTVALLAEHVMNQEQQAISSLSSEAAEQRERLSSEGKAIEEGVF